MTTAEKIAVMQAFSDGKKIQRHCFLNSNLKWEDTEAPMWNWMAYEYRIKPERDCRPYNNTDEMISDFCARNHIYRTNFGHPFIWLRTRKPRKDRDGNDLFIDSLVLQIDKDYIYLLSPTEDEFITLGMDEMFEDYTYMDGTPCGKME